MEFESCIKHLSAQSLGMSDAVYQHVTQFALLWCCASCTKTVKNWSLQRKQTPIVILSPTNEEKPWSDHGKDRNSYAGLLKIHGRMSSLINRLEERQRQEDRRELISDEMKSKVTLRNHCLIFFSTHGTQAKYQMTARRRKYRPTTRKEKDLTLKTTDIEA